MKSPEENELRAKVVQVRERLGGLTEDLRVVDAELEALAPERARHELLEQVCGSLEKLENMGAASLFWGERFEPARAAERLREARGRISEFQAALKKVDGRRSEIVAAIGREEEALEILGEDLYDARQAEERRKNEWRIEREISPLPRRVQVMAWARGGEDDRRFYKSLTASVAAGLALAAFLPMIDLPVPARFQPDQMPRRLAQLVREVQVKPVPPPDVVERLPESKPVEPETPQEPDPETPPKPTDRPGPLLPEAPAVAAVEPDPKRQVKKAGILAFREKFASLSRDDVAPRLGTDARYIDADDVSEASFASRALLTSNVPGSSGGIDLASLSRNVGGGGGGGRGGGGGGGIQGVPLGRATSPIASIGGGGGGGRPLAKDGPWPSRTDEEIQIVFDRYKASFYRLYNRELRKDPTLRGQMVLRLTIEPDGSVSMCMLQSSDMNAPDLAAQVVSRVRGINFGAKEGVQALTIVYPIDFLPAA